VLRMSRDGLILPEVIEGEGLTLRRWRAADAELLARAVAESAEHLRPWLPWIVQEPQTVEQRRAMLAEREREWAEGGDVMLAVFVGDRVAGSCGLHRRAAPDTLDIGYWIHPAFVRRGLATKVALVLTSAALSCPGIEHVVIHHDKANSASARVPAQLGFRFIGETPDQPQAPGEIGIDCAWRMSRAEWTICS
jgi:ribosomal-protein-serine acetyltransferase